MLNWKRSLLTATLSMGLGISLVGCGGEDASAPSTGSSRGSLTDSGTPLSTDLPAGMLLDTAPDGVQTIFDLKASAKEGDEVVVRVVVGGDMNPMVEGRAAMKIIDASLANPCTGDDDHCQTPWDYCCTPQEEITANLASLQILDADGRVMVVDLSKTLAPMTTLVIRGSVGPRPAPAALVINATGIYIESTSQ